jgi:signal transduction histidine kinase
MSLFVPRCAGIALENQSKMFNEFMQFNRNTLQGGGGSGLGLWICKNLATLHGGRLVAPSL